MAEDFEVRFYALLEEFEFGGKAYVDAFKAKGDDARILGDLSEEADDDDFIYFLTELMAEFGVTGAPDRRRGAFSATFGPPWPAYRLRDLTIGELKTVVTNGVWPKKAWDVKRVSVSNWIEYIGHICAFIAAVPMIAYFPLLLLRMLLPRSPTKAALAELVPVLGMTFLVLAVFRLVVLALAAQWRRWRPQVFEPLAD